MTPPLTPHSFPTDNDFHTYLRALYAYHASDEDKSSSDMLSIGTGDVVLVQLTHPSGWAFGTVLSSGVRGWVPTNYCAPYGGEPMRVLLRWLSTFYDLMRGCTNKEFKGFNYQNYVMGLHAGVKHLLVNLAAAAQFALDSLKT